MARLCQLFSAIALWSASAVAVTPVQKVVELLKNLRIEIDADGKKEAAQYDKFSCFCKEQADNKQYAIETSTKKIETLTAKIQKLTGEIDALNGEISDLGTKITGLATDIQTSTDTRKSQHDAYSVQAKDMSDALDAIDRALEALQQSKSDQGGKVALEALMQVKGVASSSVVKVLQSFVKANQPGKAYEYEYHSNDIIALLEKLKLDFTRMKNELDKDEFDTNSAFEKRRLGLQNEKKFAEQEKSEKEAQSEAKTEDRSATTDDKNQEEHEKGADSDFLAVIQAECEEKATFWDQRSKTRTEEVTAIGEAMEALTTGVKPNWGANRKLADLQKVQVSRHAQNVPESFFQLRGGAQEHPKKSAATKKALQLLSDAASRLGSSALSAAVLKGKVSEDHFVKVRSLIKDIVARLEMDAMNEKTTKEYCDTNMQAQISARDDAKTALEDLESQITGKEAEKAELEADVASLSEALAENAKALNEATELRSEESADNTETVSKAGVGKEAHLSAVVAPVPLCFQALSPTASPWHVGVLA